MFRWSLAARVKEIPANCGLNWLVRHPSVSVEELELENDAVLLDLDTPEDFQRLIQRRIGPC